MFCLNYQYNLKYLRFSFWIPESKDVYHPAHDPHAFAFVTREASSTPCSCYVFKQEQIEIIEQVVKKLKHEVGTGKRKRLGETTGESESVSYEGITEVRNFLFLRNELFFWPKKSNFIKVALLGKSTVITEKPNQELIDSVIEEFKIGQNPDITELSRPSSTNYDHTNSPYNRNLGLFKLKYLAF